MKTKIIFYFLLMLIGFSFAESFYPTTVSNLEATVRLHGNGNISELKDGETVELTVLTFQESEFQKVKVVAERLYINGKTIFPKYILDEFNNKYVQFSIPENGSFNFELIADINTTSLVHQMSDYNIGNYSEEFDIYLARSEKIESDSSEIKTVAFNKFQSSSFIKTLNETVFWVNDYVEYAKGEDFQKYYLLQQSAINTLLDRKGVCDEFANLAAAILRAKGIPTRIAVGVVFDGLNWGNHAWIEVYHRDFGWVASDPTFREAGFVDATHIKIGSFKDVSLSVAKAVYPNTAKVNFQTQTLPEVTIKNKQFFSEVLLTTQDNELKANEWNEVKIKVKNKTNGLIPAPIIARQNYSQIIINEETKSVILDGGEETEVIFRIYPNIHLERNQIARGTITFNSLSEPFEKEFTIVSNGKSENGMVFVKDITPITSKNNLIIEINIINELNENTQINIDLNNSNENYSWVESIGPFQTKNIKKEIELIDEKQLLQITTNNQIYTREILPILNAAQIIEEIRETVIVQEVPTRHQESNIDILISRPEVLLVALLIGISIILLGLFIVNKRYI